MNGALQRVDVLDFLALCFLFEDLAAHLRDILQAHRHDLPRGVSRVLQRIGRDLRTARPLSLSISYELRIKARFSSSPRGWVSVQRMEFMRN